MQMSTKLAVVDINGTLSKEVDISTAVVDANGTLTNKDREWNHELIEELQNYDKVIVVTGAIDKEVIEQYIPTSLVYDELHVKPGPEISQIAWKMSILESIQEPFTFYDDNERLMMRVHDKYGEECGILVTNMGGGGYTESDDQW